MADDVLKVFADARIDARSLSEFVYKPASFIVSRRLSPPINTLDFYLNYFDNINSTYKSSAATVQSAVNQAKQSVIAADALIATNASNASNAVASAIEGVAIDANLINDALVVTVPTFGAVDAIPRTQASKNSERISVKDFGAKGDGNQTVITVPSYQTDRDKGTVITKQTIDGDAINKAIRYLRTVGGGALYIPKGEYRVWAYLEPLDFPILIYGDGAASLIKSCDNSPTDSDGYGIFVAQPQNLEEISLRELVIDGNADVRSKPTGELRLYNFVAYGAARLRMYGVSSVNAAIDCLNIGIDTGLADLQYDAFSLFVNCYFNNSFRNTVTLGKARNCKFVNTVVSRGGYVHGGTNPRYCVDAETNSKVASSSSQWINCTFSHGYNVIFGGIWAESQFSNCLFDGSYVNPVNDTPARKELPWLFSFSSGQFDLDNCKFVGRSDTMATQCHGYNQYGNDYLYSDDVYLRIKNSSFLYCGLLSAGRSISIENCMAQFSVCPFVFLGGTKSPIHDVYIKDLRLINVFDGNNIGGGTYSSLAIKNSVKGSVDVDGITVIVDPTTINKVPVALIGTDSQKGVYFTNAVAANGKRARISNVYVEGFYKRITTYLAIPANSSTYRDWGSPTSAPLDSINPSRAITASLSNDEVTFVSGATVGKVTNKAVTGTSLVVDSVTNRTIGGRTEIIYKNCSMWGDYA